jgi:wyosine [tRNA(Phe)-imidazoG37] synthetase (radical SAM superfamily)
MTIEEKNILLEFAKLLKYVSIHTQSYECAARARDLEKILTKDEPLVESSNKYYDECKKIYDKLIAMCHDDKRVQDLKRLNESVYYITHRQKIRQELLNKLFEGLDSGENNSCSNS